MKASRFTDAQQAFIFKQAEEGTPVARTVGRVSGRTSNFCNKVRLLRVKFGNRGASNLHPLDLGLRTGALHAYPLPSGWLWLGTPKQTAGLELGHGQALYPNGFPVFNMPKQPTKSSQIVATTTCLGLRGPALFKRA